MEDFSSITSFSMFKSLYIISYQDVGITIDAMCGGAF